MILHVSYMDRIRNKKQVMHASVRREQMMMNEAEGRVGKRRGRLPNYSEISQVNDHEPPTRATPDVGGGAGGG